MKWNPRSHIIGKVYDLTQENMCDMITSFEKLKVYIESLESHILKMSCCCSGCTKHNQDLPSPHSTESLDL